MRVTNTFVLSLLLAATAIAQERKRFQFDVKGLGGQPLNDKLFEENVLIVDLWGTWCPPCRAAVPALEGLYRKYKHHGLEIVGFNYEGDAGPEQAAETVRKFAAEQGITYPLALGTPAIQQQVANFRGYPTMLWFKKGLLLERTTVGFAPKHAKELETWVREQLGLEPLPGGEAPKPHDATGDKEPVADAPQPEPEKADLPPGVIFKPGDGDKGFDFEATDVEGRALRFHELRGKPVVLVLTSTWDQTAIETAKLATMLHEKFAPGGVHVLAASLEIEKEEGLRNRKIQAFRDKHGLRHRLFGAGLGLQKKIHVFTGLPLFLVFDAEGTLVLREPGGKEATGVKVEEKLAELAK
jgi:thiol-disulfide isomerase/thioredoxin